MAKQMLYLPQFLGTEAAYLKWVRAVHNFLLSAGWTLQKTSLTATGQNIFDRPVAWSNQYYVAYGSPISPELAFDGSTTLPACDSGTWNNYSGMPTAAAPIMFGYDFGTTGNGAVDVTYQVTSYKIWLDNYAGDPAAWTFDISTDGVNWTTVDTQAGQSAPPGVATRQSYTIASPGAASRYIRWNFTATVGASNVFRIKELQALNGTTLLTNIPTSSLLSPAYTRSMTGYWEIWTPGDTLQATSPFQVQIWYGAQFGTANCDAYCDYVPNGTTGFNGDGSYYPVLHFQVSCPNVHNSYTSQFTLGNDNGDTNSSGGRFARGYLPDYTNNDTTQGRRVFMRGDASSFVIANNFDTASQNGAVKWIWSVERLRDATGSFVGDGLSVITNGNNIGVQSMVIPAYGYWNSESAYPALWPQNGQTTGLIADADGTQRVYTVAMTPFYKYTRPPLLNVANYFTTDFTSDVPFSASMYGANHTYWPLGNGWFPMYRGTAAAGVSLALLWD